MIFLYILLSLIALVLIVAAIIGTAWSIERSILINAPVDRVWNHTNTLKATNQWNPWMAKDPNIKIEYSGTDGTPGGSYSWLSNEKMVGQGSQTILKVANQSELASRVDFIKPFRGKGNAFVRLSPENGKTKVSWRMESSTPYPMNIIKIFGVIEKNMNEDFNTGLNKLKALCEQ